MVFARGVSPTLVRISIDARIAIQRMAAAAPQYQVRRMPLISFDHFPR